MPSRALVVVGGGSSARFGGEKLMTDLDGRPLVQHTIEAVAPQVDRCVLVARDDLIPRLKKLEMDIDIVPGGTTRTGSEAEGMRAIGPGYDLVGIHDAARPRVSERLMDNLYQRAWEVGGAIPALTPARSIVDRHSLEPVHGVVTVQTPQVFRSDLLHQTYRRAVDADGEGQDTAEMVERFGEGLISVVPGDPNNIKVTYPSDIELLSGRFRDPSRIDAR